MFGSFLDIRQSAEWSHFIGPPVIIMTCSQFAAVKMCHEDVLTIDVHLTTLLHVDVEWMYELRQSPLCPPQTYDLHSNDTIKFLHVAAFAICVVVHRAFCCHFLHTVIFFKYL